MELSVQIAIVNQLFHIGGVETFLLSLIRQVKRLCPEVDVFLLKPDNPNALLPDLRAMDVQVEGFESLRHGGRDRCYDVAMVTNPAALFESLRLITWGGVRFDRFIVGVYQTRMFCLDRGPRTADRGPLNLHNRLTRKVFARVPAGNAIFGNDACRDEHARVLPVAQDPGDASSAARWTGRWRQRRAGELVGFARP